MKLKHLNAKNILKLLIVIIVFIFVLNLKLLSNAFYIQKNDDVLLKNKIDDFKGKIINISYYVNNEKVEKAPDINLYKNESITCDNADILWNKKTWNYELSNPRARTINCEAKFINKETIYAHVALNSLGLDTEVGLNYDAISSDTNGKGIYSTKDTDSGKEVYFYRGNIDNNNVIFGNFCWKIVRTTETDGVKMIYSGIPENGICDASDKTIGETKWNDLLNDNAYAGYMIGNIGQTNYNNTHTNINNTYVKTIVDSWFENNLISYLNKLDDEPYCNDKSLSYGGDNNAWGTTYSINNGYGTTYTLYAFGARGATATSITDPTLKCKNNNDKYTVSSIIGNGKLKYPIAMISADEIIYAGHTGGINISTKSGEKTNKNFYLYDSKSYWTMTPMSYSTYYKSVFRMCMLNNGRLYQCTTDNISVRPVISLKGDLLIYDGEGTKEDPFVIK